MLSPMPEAFVKFLQRWVVTTIAVLVADLFVSGIDHKSVGSLLGASALLGLLNAFVRPLLLLISLPLLIWTLGLFILVINAMLLLMVGALLRPGFAVDGFWAAFWGGVIISIVSMIVNAFLGRGPKVKITRGKPGTRGNGRRLDDDGGGPIIDV